jgi:5'(3')-deoxyribonucleotidase
MIYLDMDGVIADFFGAIEKKYGVSHWKSIQDRDIKFAELANTDFFYTIPLFDVSQKIINHVSEVAFSNEIEWGICSSPLRGDTNNSAYWKRRWLEDNNFVPPLIENMVFTGNKHKYAINQVKRKPNILIDDKPENILRWINAGGIGIRYQANEDDLNEYLFAELEKAIEIYRTA